MSLLSSMQNNILPVVFPTPLTDEFLTSFAKDVIKARRVPILEFFCQAVPFLRRPPYRNDYLSWQKQMTPSKHDPSTEGWNLLFKKFVSIWVWSILFSSITGLGISYMQVSTISKIPDFHGISLFVTLIQLLIILAAAIIAVIAYINLFHYFRLSILPILVDIDILEGMGNYEPSVRTRKSLFALTKAYKLLIAGGVIRMASWFIDYLYNSFLELFL